MATPESGTAESTRQRLASGRVLGGKRRQPLLQFLGQIPRAGPVRRRTGPDHQIYVGELGQDSSARTLPQSASEIVPRHRRRAVARHHDPEPRMAQVIGPPGNVQLGSSTGIAGASHRLEIRLAQNPPTPWQRLGRQRPPCFDGSKTASFFRPFLRRRFKTSRPQRVFIRARKPCLFSRRLFRGRYVGPISHLKSSRES